MRDKRRFNMRKTMIILLAVLAVVMLASCSVDKGNSEENTMSHNTNQDLEALFQTVCSADDALELARKSNIPVLEPISRIVFLIFSFDIYSFK